MYPSEVASLKAVKEALADVDSVCERCMLRFAGIKNSRSCKADNLKTEFQLGLKLFRRRDQILIQF